MSVVSPTIGWSILALVFLDELLAMAAFGVWAIFASPKATLGGPIIGPIAKVVVFGLATWALFDTGYPTAAWLFLAFSVLINGAALFPGVRDLAASGLSIWVRGSFVAPQSTWG